MFDTLEEQIERTEEKGEKDRPWMGRLVGGVITLGIFAVLVWAMWRYQ